MREQVNGLATTTQALPNSAGGFANHRRIRLAAEGLCELGHVRDDAVDAPAVVGVFVAERLQAGLLWSFIHAPDLGVANVEALFGSVAFDGLLREVAQHVE